MANETVDYYSLGVDNQTLVYMDNKHFIYDPSTWSLSRFLNVIGTPCIIVCGIIGNILSLLVFLFTRMRSQTCSVYLSHLNLSDTGFLLSLIPAWLGWVNINVFNNGLCQLMIFATFVFSFTSTYTVVAFTIERYIVVYHPLKKSSMCTKKRALIVLLILDATACVAYSFCLWMISSTCDPKEKYKDAFKIIVTVDAIVTYIIPSLSIIIFNCAILLKVYMISRQMNITLEETIYSDSDNDNEDLHRGHTRTTSINSNRSKPRPKSTHRSKTETSSRRRRRMYKMKTTRSLVLVSTSFILLNMPSHLFRVYVIFSEFYNQPSTFSDTVAILQEISLFVYNGNFAINVFLYVLVSQSFRYGFISLVKATRHKVQRFHCDPCVRHCQRKMAAIPCLTRCLPTSIETEMNTISIDRTGDQQ